MLKQRALIRSIVDFNHDKKELEYILDNYSYVTSNNVEFNLDIHVKILDYINQHTEKFVDVPSFDRLRKYFEDDSDTLEELEKIKKEKTLYDTNFKSLCDEVITETKQKKLTDLLKETSVISVSGKKIDRKTFVQGPKQAVEYFLHNSIDFLKSKSNVRTTGSVKGFSHEAIKEYYEVKKNNRFDGLLTGLPSIDLVCKGIRSPELWLVVAYVSELKTTMTLNFAYTQAIEQGKNVQFVTLEMPYKDMRNMFICIHSANLNLWPGSQWDDVYPLSYDDLVDGKFSHREEEFFNFLCNDLDTNPEYGSVNIYQPEDGMTMSHLKAWAEVEFRKNPFDILYLDYIELMKSENPSKDYSLELNQRIKDLKQFALHFNDGKGLRIVSAYQANRKGKEHADKNDGEYRLDGLSYANEAERSADVIVYSYLNDELRANNQNKIGCLKNRSRPKFRQFLGKTNLASRKIYEASDEGNIVVDDKLEKNNNIKKADKDELINDLV
jgi:replicative DNA helicase